MKLKYIAAFLLSLIITSCDDHDDVAPGLYVDLEEIATFPGDEVWVEGQASNYLGISLIEISCDAWGVAKTITPKGEPKVYNYSWKMEVPSTATFPETLSVVVHDVNGLSTTRTVTLSFAPDITAPWVTTSFPDQVSVDFDTELAKGVWDLSLNLEDDRALSMAHISIPEIAYDESIELSGRSATLNKSFDFTSIGNFEAEIVVSDSTGNELKLTTSIVVMLAEEEDPYELYDQMCAIIATENESDYVNGYYHFMDPGYSDGEIVPYTYTCKFYAPEDGTQVYFTPSKSIDADLFGVSPYVSSKLMNKNGYVVPVTIEKAGYYYLWIDLANHCYSISELNAEPGCTEPVLLSGTGFVFGDWGASDYMTQVSPGRYEIETELVDGYTDDIMYYFYTDGWVRVFRADADGQWWFESASGSCCTFKSGYYGKVIVTFDSTEWWASIRKAN